MNTKKINIVTTLYLFFISIFSITPSITYSFTLDDNNLDPITEGPRPVRGVEYRIGEKIPDLSFQDLEGKTGKLSDYQNGKPIVIAMNLVDCPICRKFAPTLIQMQREWGPRGVTFLMVNGNQEIKIEELREKVSELGLTARYIPDLEGKIGKALMAQSSSEVFILDRTRTLVYRGPVSDQFGLGYSMAQPKKEYLKLALEAVFKEKMIEVPALFSPGCFLGIQPDNTPEVNVTYHNRISRLIQYNCQNCHRPGEAAPFALMNYADVKGRAPMIRYVVDKKIMPPWFASSQHGKWINDRSLTVRDRTALLNWIKAGKPEGDPADAPLEVAWPKDWIIGNPDAIITIPDPISVPAGGVMPYQYVTVKTDFPEDRWVKSMELRSTHPEVVHHILVFLKPKDQASMSTRDIVNVDGFLAASVPGSNSITFPEGAGKKLPQGTELIFQIHYTPNGTAVEDRPHLALQFSPKVSRHEVTSKSAYNRKFLIPAGDPNYPVEATYTFEKKTRILSFMPHMHLRGKAFRYELTFPDQKVQTLLDIPRYDFNWQLRYLPEGPIDVPKGAILKVTGWFDNSADNPSNPDHTIPVGWGEQSTDEMLIGYFDSYPLE